MNDISIGIIGEKGSGKTTYIAAMLRKLFRASGTVLVKYGEQEAALINNLQDAEAASTDEITVYHFQLFCCGQELFTVSIMDYPGDALEVSHPLHAQVMEFIKKASSHIFLINGERFGEDTQEIIDYIKNAKHVLKEDVPFSRQLGLLKDLLNINKTLSFVVTKTDRIDPGDNPELVRDAIIDGVESFVYGSDLPVSNYITAIFSTAIYRDDDGLQTLNVEYPILFALVYFTAIFAAACHCEALALLNEKVHAGIFKEFFKGEQLKKEYIENKLWFHRAYALLISICDRFPQGLKMCAENKTVSISEYFLNEIDEVVLTSKGV